LLPAPLKPEQSENIDSNHLRKIISCCKDQFDYILIDTHSLLQDISINALDLSDMIMLIMNPDMAHFVAIHNCLKVMDSLKYPKEKVHIVLNRFDMEHGKTKEEWLSRSIYQILTDRFARTSDKGDCNLGSYCGGNYQGIIKKIRLYKRNGI
jgi:pilus assembly protein CpaE